MLSGQCLCGGVRYTIARPPRRMVHCHCSICRRSSGASFGTAAIVGASDLSIVSGQDLIAVFESSRDYRRYFCSRCGSPLYGASELAPQILMLRCGTLDADPQVRPSIHIHVEDRAPWIEISDDLEKFEGAVGAEDFRRIYSRVPEGSPPPMRIRTPTTIPARPEVETHEPLSGRCMCGGVRYAINRAPRRMYYCHCGNCRRSTGASFGTAAILGASDFSITAGQDQIASFESSKGVWRHFCSRCGSPLYSLAELSPQILWLSCGTLDGDPRVRPSFHRNVEDRAPWVEISDDLEKFAGAVGPKDLRRLYFSEA